MNGQLYTILSYYLKKANISFSKFKLKQLLSSHPDKNSLYAMVDVLDELNIENAALRLDMESLQTNGFPVIVHCNCGKNRNEFVVVEDIFRNKVHYYDAINGNVIKSLEEFTTQWSSVALYAEQDEIQAELERKKTRLKSFYCDYEHLYRLQQD